MVVCVDSAEDSAEDSAAFVGVAFVGVALGGFSAIVVAFALVAVVALVAEVAEGSFPYVTKECSATHAVQLSAIVQL